MHTYKVFGINSAGWWAGGRHHDRQDELVQLIDILAPATTTARSSHVEVHDGSSSVRP
jgi:hypothetical protein